MDVLAGRNEGDDGQTQILERLVQDMGRIPKGRRCKIRLCHAQFWHRLVWLTFGTHLSHMTSCCLGRKSDCSRLPSTNYASIAPASCACVSLVHS